MAETPRADLYERVTSRIIAELEAGRLPWVQPWANRDTTRAAALPRSAVTGRAYSGINILLLWDAMATRGWRSHAWLTFRQALAAGGGVRKGEHGTRAFYADRFTPREEAERAAREGGEPRAIPFLKSFTLFNVAQCEGLSLAANEPPPSPEGAVIPAAEAVIAASKVDFRIGGDAAFYVPAHDYVQVPPQSAFFAPIDYYRTALHELTHATGHAARLDRQLMNGLDAGQYAREELVAEMGSAFLCAALGITPTVRHADYIGAWLGLLRADARILFRAASHASKAADWLLERRGGAPGEGVAA